MELSEVKQIVETSTVNATNAYLELGWVLLNSLQMRDGEAAWVKYALGWTGATPAPKPADPFL